MGLLDLLLFYFGLMMDGYSISIVVVIITIITIITVVGMDIFGIISTKLWECETVNIWIIG